MKNSVYFIFSLMFLGETMATTAVHPSWGDDITRALESVESASDDERIPLFIKLQEQAETLESKGKYQDAALLVLRLLSLGYKADEAMNGFLDDYNAYLQTKGKTAISFDAFAGLVKDPKNHKRIVRSLAAQWSVQDKAEDDDKENITPDSGESSHVDTNGASSGLAHESSADEYVSDGESSGKP